MNANKKVLCVWKYKAHDKLAVFPRGDSVTTSANAASAGGLK
jgi:hypothetical protein